MKQVGNYFWVLGISLFLGLSLNGCVSVSSSPASRFYMLQAEHKDKVIKETSMDPNLLIAIGPVKIPQYLDRPQIVTQTEEKTLKFAEFDRWGERLDAEMQRAIRDNLSILLPSAKFTLYPWNPALLVKYQVLVEVVQLDCDLDKDLFFSSQWTIIDAENMKTLLIKKTEFRQPISPQNYTGLAKGLSVACASLSGEIADALEGLKTTGSG